MNDWKEVSSLHLPEVLDQSSEDYSQKKLSCIRDGNDNLPTTGFGASYSATSCLSFLIWKIGQQCVSHIPGVRVKKLMHRKHLEPCS